MGETYLVFLVGAIAGLIASFMGGMILYRNRLKTHVMLREKVEAERTALQDELSEIDKEELAETDAGKELMILSQASARQFGYARENLTTGLKRHNYDLLKQIDEHRKRLAQSEERLTAMAALQKEADEILENLKKENAELRAANSVKNSMASASAVQLEQDLRIALKEVARLQNQLAEANMRLIEAEADGITGFSQELRQTLSSTLQTLDVLSDESIGNLNPMQRNLLETMKASIARLHDVIEGFIQVTTLKADSHKLVRERVDVNSIVQDATDKTNSEVRAKRISLDLNMPENLPTFYADREALGQILIHLLSNAIAISPLQGTVRLRAQIKAEDDKEYLLIQVSDTGGGIPREDLGRVFIPRFRTDDIPVRGVGDLGMGLYVVKTLTEAQNGRIWVDTGQGVGSTYSVLIPIARNSPVNVSVDG
jgi:signal transduction histidine kinase